MEKLRLFFAAAFLAAFTGGCPTMPTPPVDSDTGLPPTDAWVPPGTDTGPDPVDAYVPPGEDAGTDAGTLPSVCEDPEFIGNMCNLPTGMAYIRTEFICGTFLNNDLWITDEVGAVPGREGSREEAGVFYAWLTFAYRNGGMNMRPDVTPEFTCGNEGRCWLNWTNPVSNYSHCRVTFFSAAGDGRSPGCDWAETECWPPGSATPVVSSAFYVGE